MHLIFTPKGQRLRSPNFGTRLIEYIFNPDDGETWGNVVSEIKECVKMWIPSCNLKDIEVVETEDGLTLAVKIIYTLTARDGMTKDYEIITTL